MPSKPAVAVTAEHMRSLGLDPSKLSYDLNAGKLPVRDLHRAAEAAMDRARRARSLGKDEEGTLWSSVAIFLHCPTLKELIAVLNGR